MDKEEILIEIETLKYLDATDWNHISIEEQNLKSKALVILNQLTRTPDDEDLKNKFQVAKEEWMVINDVVKAYIRLRHLRIELAKLAGFDILKLNNDLTMPEPGPDPNPKPNKNGQLNLF